MSEQRLHTQAIVGNLHDDWSIEVQKRFLAGERGALERTYLDRMRRGGIDFTFYTVGGDDIMFTQDLDLLRGSLRAIDGALEEIRSADNFVLCRTADEILAARENGMIGLIFTIEGVGPIGEDLAFLRLLYRLGLRSAILTWFKANPSADGVGERRNGGLTSFGRELVAEMDRLGILIDISQSAPATIEDVFALSKHPIIASHSNCGGLYPHRRNLSDDQLRALALKDGVIGLTSYPAHVGNGQVAIEDFVRHIDYAVNLIGIEHVAIGLNIVVHDPEEARMFYERSGIEYSAFHLMGLEDLDKMENITTKLLNLGYSESDIRMILGENVLRVIRAVMG